jgi:hypothetical protein
MAVQSDARKLRAARVGFDRIELALAVMAMGVGLYAGFRLLTRGVWIDEFFTLSMTRGDLSPERFLELLKLDVHPALHFTIIWLERMLGVDSVFAMRATNLLGAPVIAWALWFGFKNGALSRVQALTIAVMCATSTVFLENFAEIRGYFLQGSASVSLVVLWRIFAMRIQNGEKLTKGLFLGWGLVLAMLANLHYFGTMLGGLLTATLMLDLILKKDFRPAIILAVIGLIAAAPAVALASVQINHQPEHFWIETSPEHSLELFVQFLRAIVLNNLAAVGCALAGIFYLFEREEARRESRSILVLAGVTLVFFGALFALNTVKPMIIPRYLTPAIGPLLVGIALLATGKGMPKWAGAMISAFAILAVVEAVTTDKHAREGWDVSAARVADLVRACPDSKVYVEAHVGTGEDYVLPNITRETGYGYYQSRFNLPLNQLERGQVVPAPAGCPSIFWVEHTYDYRFLNLDARGVLNSLGLRAAGPATLEWVGSGGIILVRNPEELPLYTGADGQGVLPAARE